MTSAGDRARETGGPIAPEDEAQQQIKLSLMLDQVPAVLWTTDAELRFTSSSGLGLARLGLAPGEVVGRTLFEYFGTQDDGFPPLRAARRALEGHNDTYTSEWAGRVYESHVEPLRDVDGRITGTIGIALDITERQRLTEELAQARRLEALGRLAGGVAHDFNNLLTVVLGAVAEARTALAPEGRGREAVDLIGTAAERAAGLTRQLLAFAREQVVEPRVVDLNERLRHAGQLLGRLIGEHIEIRAELAADPLPVLVDPDQLEQVLINLAANARDAMPGGGVMTVRTREATVEAGLARPHPEVEPGHWVVLELEDTGPGMSPEVLARAFEPFYTTKQSGRGTGLGLATCHGILRQAGGHIFAASAPDRGSVFTLWLPHAEREPEPPRPREPWRSPGAHVAAVRGNILLAEDEPLVREILESTLSEAGCSVLVASSGAEALELARDHSGRIDLLLTDLVMPGMSGLELAERFHAVEPDVPVLLMSGYAEPARLRELPDWLAGHLAKPFDSAALMERVRGLIGGARESPG